MRIHATSSVLILALVGCAKPSTSGPVTVDDNERPPSDAGAPVNADLPEPVCAGTPDAGPTKPWRHDVESPLIVAVGSPSHRGLDLIADATASVQTIAGEIHYGLVDKALEDEEVDLFACRAGAWQGIGSAITDDNGAFALDLRDDQRLPIGQRALYVSVAGDRSGVAFLALVAPAGSWVVVSDVDGTLTSSENAFPESLVSGATVSVNDGAPAALSTLQQRRYLPVYLTARGRIFTEDTRSWLATNQLPPGPLRLAPSLVTLPGDATVAYKSSVLAAIDAAGLTVKVGIGNRASDAAAYGSVGLDGKHIFLKQPEFASENAPVIAAGNAIGFDSYVAVTPTFAVFPVAP